MSYKAEIYGLTEEECPYDYAWRMKLVVTVDGQDVEEYWDGGEPEDQRFNRDWGWVPRELKRAYEQGLKDGKK